MIKIFFTISLMLYFSELIVRILESV